MRKGFTLIELIVTLGAIGIIMGIIYYGMDKAQLTSRDAARVKEIARVQNALEKYYADKGKYPIVGVDVGTDSINYGNCTNFRSLPPPNNWAMGGFGGLLMLLQGTNQLNTTTPYLQGPILDPSTRNVGIGYACSPWTFCNTPGTLSCSWGDLGKGAKLGDVTVCGWDHCSIMGNATPWPAGYHYNSDGKVYTIILMKEAGGTQVFNSP